MAVDSPVDTALAEGLAEVAAYVVVGVLVAAVGVAALGAAPDLVQVVRDQHYPGQVGWP